MRIQFKWLVNDIPTDPDGNVVKLRNNPLDSTPAYGVRRQDNHTVIVPAGTNMIRVSQGIYEYSFPEANPSVVYEYVFEFTSEGELQYVARTQVANKWSNNLSTTAEADEFFDNFLHAEAWFALTPEKKDKVLFAATELMNRYNYKGSKTNPLQINEFPRDGSLLIPDDILKAYYYAALSIADGFDVETEVRGLRVTSRGYSAVRTTYDPDNIPEYLLAGFPSAVGWGYLFPYLRESGTVRLHRVS